MKKIRILLIFIFLLAGISLLLFVFNFKSNGAESILVKIPDGASAKEIANILYQKKVISSPKLFLVLVKLKGDSVHLKKGTYLLKQNSYFQTFEKLEKGLSENFKVTFPEGWTSYQIAQRLKAMGILDQEILFLEMVKKQGLEGTLFPETYIFSPMSNPEEIIHAMSLEFKKKYRDEFKIRARQLQMKDLEILTLASIIEREAQRADEMPLISSVYHNRLKKKILLQADPTVQYALSQGKYWQEKLIYKDLKIDSPYNTYRYPGLPPGPICNPGLHAIQAALYPVRTNYLYFVADGAGRHYFFTNYKEHLQKQISDSKKNKISKK